MRRLRVTALLATGVMLTAWVGTASAAVVAVRLTHLPRASKRLVETLRAVNAATGAVAAMSAAAAHRSVSLGGGVYILVADAAGYRLGSHLVGTAGVVTRSRQRVSARIGLARYYQATDVTDRPRAVSAAGQDVSVLTAQGVTITGAPGSGQPPINLDGALNGYLFQALHGDGVKVVDQTPQVLVAVATEQALSAAGRLGTRFTYNPLAPNHFVRGEGTITPNGRVNLELKLDDASGAIVAIVHVSGRAKDLRDVVIKAVHQLADQARNALKPKPEPVDCGTPGATDCYGVQVTAEGLFDETGGWGSGVVTAPGKMGKVAEGFDSVEHGFLGEWARGTHITLLATPNRGSHFSRWGGACSGTSETCTLTAAPNLDATAYFAEDLWHLTIVNENPSGGEVAGELIGCGIRENVCSRVISGQTSDKDFFRLSVNPESSHMISALRGCDRFTGSFTDGGECDVAATSDKTITVDFACNPDATSPCSGTGAAPDVGLTAARAARRAPPRSRRRGPAGRRAAPDRP